MPEKTMPRPAVAHLATLNHHPVEFPPFVKIGMPYAPKVFLQWISNAELTLKEQKNEQIKSNHRLWPYVSIGRGNPKHRLQLHPQKAGRTRCRGGETGAHPRSSTNKGC